MANLTTLAKARQQIFGNDPSIEADDILNQLITSSSAWVEREIGGDLIAASFTETLDGDGGTRMRLKHSHSWRPGFPTTTVTLVKVDGETISARPAVTSTDTNPDGWLYRDDGVDLVGFRFTKGKANVVITYTAGFDACPADIEQAVLEHIAIRYSDRSRAGLASMSSAGESASFSNAGSLAFISGVLDTYRALGVS